MCKKNVPKCDPERRRLSSQLAKMQAPALTGCSSGHRPAWCWEMQHQVRARPRAPPAASSSGSRRLRRSLLRAAPAAYSQHLTSSAQPAPWPASPLDQQHTAASKPPKRGGGGALPDQQLAAAIRACSSLADCLALLQAHAAQLDAMLISALVTQTVALHVAAQQRAAPALQAAGPSLWQRPQEEEQQQQQTLEAGSQAGSQGNGSTHWAAAPPPPIAAGPQPTAAGSTRSSGKAALRLTTTYLRLLADVALRSAASGGFRPQQFANVLWGLARLGHKPQPAWLDAYLAQAEQQLQSFRPRDFAQLLWAVATLRAVPAWHGSSFARVFFAASGPRLPWFGPQDLANILWGCTVLRAQPPPAWLAAAVAGVQQQWARFKPQELSITLLCLAKLGVAFQDPCDASAAGQPTQQQQQQQQQQQSAASPTRTAAAGPAVSPGWHWLVLAAARAMPLMGPQEVANLLWGLAAGRAALHEQELQALANQAFIILAQSATRSRGCTVSLTVCLWSLARLAWRPSLPQAQLLVRLLSEVLASGALDMRHTCVLLWSLGRLRLRPQAPAMHELLDRQVLAGLPSAGPAVVCMALGACRNLGWRPSRGWWECFYQDSLAALQAAAAPELITMLSAAAAVRPLRPTQPWWEAFWDSMGVELEATVQARGLERVAITRNLPKGPAGPALAAAAAAGVKARASRAAAGSDSGADADSSPEAAPEPSEEADNVSSTWLASPWLHITEALQVVANLHAKRLTVSSPHSRALVTPRLAVQLLWACARLNHCPPQAQLWQLLLLLLANVHALPSRQLTCVAWSLGRLLERHEPKRLRCFALVKRLALVAQWRLLAGLAPGGLLSSSSSDAAAEAGAPAEGADSVVLQRRRYVAALRYLVRQGWLQPYMLSLSNSQQRLHEAAGRVGC